MVLLCDVPLREYSMLETVVHRAASGCVLRMAEMSSISLPLLFSGSCVLNHGVHVDVSGLQSFLLLFNDDNSCAAKTLCWTSERPHER